MNKHTIQTSNFTSLMSQEEYNSVNDTHISYEKSIEAHKQFMLKDLKKAKQKEYLEEAYDYESAKKTYDIQQKAMRAKLEETTMLTASTKSPIRSHTISEDESQYAKFQNSFKKEHYSEKLARSLKTSKEAMGYSNPLENMSKELEAKKAIPRTVPANTAKPAIKTTLNINPKFSFFARLGNIFNMQTETPEQKKLNSTIAALIENKLLDKVLEFTSQGFILNNTLQKRFDVQMYAKIDEDPRPLFNKLASKNIHIEQKYILAFLKSKHSEFALNFIFSEIDNNPDLAKTFAHLKGQQTSYSLSGVDIFKNKYTHLAAYLAENFQSKSFRRTLFLEWKELIDFCSSCNPSVFARKEHEVPTAIVEKFKQLKHYSPHGKSGILFCAEASMEEYLESMQKVHVAIGKYKKFIQDYKSPSIFSEILSVFSSDYNFDNDPQHWLKIHTENFNTITSFMEPSFEKLYNKNLQTIETQIVTNPKLSIKTQISKVLKESHVDTLPATAQTIIDNINKLYRNLKKNEQYLNDNSKHDLEIMATKRIVQIVEKYCDIDTKYRDTLANNEGKTGQFLMIEALTNIEELFTHLEQGINEIKIGSLSATQRYTKDVKEGYIPKELGSEFHPDLDLSLNNNEEDVVNQSATISSKPKMNRI